MSLDWALVGGDPAPGDVQELESAAGVVRRVRREVASHLSEVRGLIGGWEGSGWSGPAADRFIELLRAIERHLEQMEAAHEPVGRALSSHASILAEKQPEARRLLQRAHDAVTRRAIASDRQAAARQDRSQAAVTAGRVESDLAGIGDAIISRTQQLMTAGAHLVGDAVGVLDPHLQWLRDEKRNAEELLASAQRTMGIADEVIAETGSLIAQAESDLEVACRRAEQIAAEVVAAARAEWRLISEVTHQLEGIWRHVEQDVVNRVNESTAMIAAQLSAISPALAFAFRQYVQFDKGVIDGAIGMVAGVAAFGAGVVAVDKVLWDLSPVRYVLDPAGWRRSTLQIAVGVDRFVAYVSHHPGEFFKTFGKDLLNWDTWAHDPAKAIGELVPSIALAVATAGAGVGVTAAVRTTGVMDTTVGVVESAEGVATGVGPKFVARKVGEQIGEHFDATDVAPEDPVVTPDEPITLAVD